MALATKETLEAANRVLPDSSERTMITPKINLPVAGIPMSTGGGNEQSDAFSKALFLVSPSKPSKLSSSSSFNYNPLDIDTSGRYDRFVLGADNEDIQGKLQSNWDKAANGLLKGVGIAGTTFLEGTVGLVAGIGSAISNGSMNKFYNNDFSNYMSSLNEKMENNLPNYYTSAERDAKWYQPENLLTANFFWDKIIKNLGFSVGALYAGNVTAGLLGQIPALFNISKAGKLAQVADALEAGLQGVPELERAAKAKDIIAQTSKTINTLNKIATADRFIISGLSAATEGGIEALQGMNDYRDKLMSAYRDKFGEDPTGEELNKINNASADLGNARFGLNMLLLTGTNYVQLPKILGASYRSGKNNLINSAATNLETGLLESSLPTKGIAKRLYQAKNIAGLFVSPSEGFEEGAQYAIEKGTQEYYNKKDYNRDASLSEFLTSFGEAAGKGIKAIADKEGMESVLIGALSGGIQQAGFVGSYKNEQGKTRVGFGKSGEIGERGLTGYGGEMAKNTAELIAKSKPFSLKGDSWLKDTTDAVVRGVALQEEFEALVRQGDILESKDKEFDYQQNYLLPRIKYGRYDLVKDDIEAYRQLASTVEGFNQLKEKGVAGSLDSRDSFLNRLNNFEEHAKVVNSLHESLNIRYGGLVDKDTNQRLYSDDVIDQMIYAASKISDYDKRAPQLANNLIAAGINIDAVLGDIVTGGVPSEEATKEAIAKIDSLPVTEDEQDDLKRDLRDSIELGLRRKQFINEYNEIKNKPKEYSYTETSKETGAPKETIKIKTKTGEGDYEIGTEYFLGKVVEEDKAGNEVYRFPKLTILGKNDDGTIKIRSSNRNVKDISEAELADYKLGKVSSVQGNKTANYFMNHANDVYQYNFGKDFGGKRRGRLQYENDKLFFVYKDAKGKVKRLQVDNSHFVAQEGYKDARLKKVGTLTAESADQKASREAFTSTEELKKQKETLAKNRDTRREIVVELEKEARERLEKANETLAKKSEQLKKIEEELAELQEVKAPEARTKREKKLEEKYPELSRQKIRFSNIFSKTSKAVTQLASLKQTLTDEIAQLTAEKEELEFNLEYFGDFSQNLDELPENSGQFLKELREQVGWLDALVKETGSNINSLVKLSNSIDKVLKNLTGLLKDAVTQFNSDYPEYIRDTFNSLVEGKSVLTDIATIKGYIADQVFIEDVKKDISVNQERLDSIPGEIEDLYKQLDEIVKEYNAKKELLDKFEELAKEYKDVQNDKKLLEANKNNIEEAQFESERLSGDVATADPNALPKQPKEDGRKHWSVLFRATTGQSQKDLSTLSAHAIRANTFLNNFKNFVNKDAIKVIFVTINQEAGLGLTGLTKQALNKEVLTDEEALAAADIDNGVVAAVLIQDNEDGTRQYVDQEGNPIGEVSTDSKVDINKVIFQTMPNTSTTWLSNGEPRYREGEKEQADEQAAAWKAERTTLFEARSGMFDIYNFRISRGKPVDSESNEKNFVGDNLIPENVIATQEGLIEVSSTGTIAHEEEQVNLNYPKGRAVLKYGDTVQPINNTNITKDQAEAIFAVFKAMYADLIKQIKTNKPGEKIGFDKGYMSFLQNVLYWRQNNDKGNNQVYINTSTLELHIGDKTYSILDLDANEELITKQLQGVYHNINNKTLTGDTFTDKFTEYFLNDTGNLEEREWRNYQSYLLSSTYPNGDARTTANTPLVTNVPKATDLVPFNYINKYMIIDGLDLVPQTATPAAPIVVEEVKTATPKTEALSNVYGEYTADGKTEFAFPIKAGNGDVMFTTTVDNGTASSSIKSGQPAVAAAFNNPEKDANGKTFKEKAFDELSKRGLYIGTLEGMKADDVIDYIQLFINSRVQKAVNDKLAEQVAPTKEEIAVATPSVIDEPVEAVDQPPVTVKVNRNRDSRYQRVTEVLGKIVGMTNADVETFRAFVAEKIPTMPFEYLDHLIATFDNEEAFGALEDGVVKIFKGAPKQTAYHEAFHFIFNGFLSTEQQQALLTEFQSKRGSFLYRGQTIDYSDATMDQMEEKLGDDFAEFKVGKLPARNLGEKIRRFFKAIVDFFKSFVADRSLKTQLFKDINAGKFANESYPEAVKSLNPKYSRTPGLTNQQTHEFVNDMISLMAQMVFETNKNLYDLSGIVTDNIFNRIRQIYTSEGLIGPGGLTDASFNDLIGKTKDYLRQFKVNYEDGSKISINDVNKTKDYEVDPFSIDWKKHSNFAIKFALATLIEREYQGASKKASSYIELPDAKPNSFGGSILVDFGRTFGTLMEKLSNTTNVKKLVGKLITLAKDNPNYVALFNRVGGNAGEKEAAAINFNNFKRNDWRFFINFFQTFSKQKPEGFIQYTNSEGRVYTRSANLRTASKEVENQWIEKIRQIAKEPNSIIKYNSKDKVYKVTIPATVKINLPQDMIKFLNSIGIGYTLDDFNRLNKSQVKSFNTSVGAIFDSLKKSKDILSLSGDTLKIGARLSKLAELYVDVTSPKQDGTYFGINGKMKQSYADNNAPSYFENTFNTVKTLTELKAAMPWLNDVFSAGSQILAKGGLFFDDNGVRNDKQLKVQTIEGGIDTATGKDKDISSLTEGERFTLEINQNINGRYYILIPADSSTEWMMNLGNRIDFKRFQQGKGLTDVHPIFQGYLKDDINLAKDFAKRQKLNNIGKDKAKELRFFKDILPEGLVTKITNDLILKNANDTAIDEFIEKNQSAINAAVDSYLNNQVKQLKTVLESNREIVTTKNGYAYKGLDGVFADDAKIDKNNLSEQELTNLLQYIISNYNIANIEYHKFLFGDPLQFSTEDGKLDETKRVKSFLSPRRFSIDMPELNSYLNTEYNKTGLEGRVGRITLRPEDPGYHKFKSFLKTFTISEVNTANISLPNYMRIKEADANSWITAEAYRESKWKNGQWSDDAEEFYQWHMAYTRQKLAEKGQYSYEKADKNLEKHDVALIATPMPDYKIEVLKPIVSGNKAGENNFNLVLDKFSQMPLFYHAIEGTTLEKLYLGMMKGEYDYAIIQSGRKVGIEGMHPLYNAEGKFNEAAINNTVNVPWSVYGIQVENSYADKLQTLGSQLTKIATIDIYKDGVPTTEAGGKAAVRNQKALDGLIEYGYKRLLKKLGIKDLGNTFSEPDNIAVSELIRDEMLKREVSNNVLETITIDRETGTFKIPFEASTAYKQIKDILYSMVDKNIASPKMNGFSAVQTPVTGWENAAEGRRVVEINGKKVFTSDFLKFYEDKDGRRYCEVMIPHWFKEQFKEAGFTTDAQLLEYLNLEENQSILEGIGFRIPTQGLNSVEVFKVKGFLPSYMGSTIVVPSEITNKAGSDFDIDKLNLYLKNTYVTLHGEIKEVPFFGYGKEGYAAVKNFIKQQRLDKVSAKSARLAEDDENGTNTLADKLYNQSLENEYYNSLKELLTLPENFDRLTSPNTDKELQEIAGELSILRGEDESNIPNRILDKTYMTKLRHAFIIAKRWVGIGAVNITGHSLMQKIKGYVDTNKIAALSEYDKRWLKDGSIALPHNTINVNGTNYVSLSGTKEYSKKGIGAFISDKLSMFINAFVDVAKDPYILKIISSNRVVSTFMFLQRIGVPTRTTAMFMNQPIIKEYLNYLDAYSEPSLFNVANVEQIEQKFPTTLEAEKNAGLDINTLDENIKNYYANKVSGKKFNDAENAEQRYILKEFLKYASMAQHMFDFTQAVNYDTTRFRSDDSLFNKQVKTELAANNIISSVDKVLDATHIGKLANFLDKASTALGAIMKLNQEDFRDIIEDVLRPYAENKFLSNDIRETIANKAVASFLDFIIQTNIKSLNLKDLLVNENSVADRLVKAQVAHPEVKMLNELTVASPTRPDGTKSIKLKANLKNAYDENLYVEYMREMRDNPATNALYNDIVKLAITQGTYASPIAIKNIVPLEDYAAIVAPIINTLAVTPKLESFKKNANFQRNNWRDKNIVGSYNPVIWQDREPYDYDQNTGEDLYYYYSPAFPIIETLKTDFQQKRIVEVPAGLATKEVITIPRVVTDPKGKKIDLKEGIQIFPSTYAYRREQGDYSLNDVYGFKKVYNPDGSPVTNTTITKDGRVYVNHVYKAINLYGDGIFATEQKLDNTPSELNNGTAEVKAELDDAPIIAYYNNMPQASQFVEKVVPSQPMGKTIPNKPEFSKLPSKSSAPTMTYAGIGSRQTPKEMLSEMTALAKELQSKGYTLNTGVTFGGKKEGADKAFDDGATKKNLFSPENQGSREREQIIAKEMHPNPNALSPGALKLMARNTNQVFGDNLNTPVDFVVFYAKETKGIRPEGGTGQAVEMARLKGIPTINLANPNWRAELDKALKSTSKIKPEGKPAIDNTNNNNCG